ncbi:AraC family transcriptional regulator [Antribacter gilvus]|uniref:AraC family transcriptional regulator n=1 Tax=Antribacter gilvus TaxID=2304675 RepID=UPI0013DFF75D|nr:helix-turn-helix domain-containing protein [Antribacter gilvus]
MFDPEMSPRSTLGLVDPEAARQHFRLTRLAPAADLADLVEWHWVITWDLLPGGSYTQVVVPHPCANVVAEADVFAAHAMPAGLFERTLTGAGGVVGTKLRPGALRVLAGLPGAGRRGEIIPAERFLGEGVDVARASALAVAGALAGRPESAVGHLTPLFQEAARRNGTLAGVAAVARVTEAFAVLRSLGPAEPVAGLAAALGTTPRSLQRLFADWVGVGPKWVLQRHRVHLAAELLAREPARELAELAAEVGYYDQAHFSTDFARATGHTPAAYARRCAGSLTTV